MSDHMRIAMGVVACLLFAVGPAQATVKIDTCNVCYSDAGFAYRAEQFSINSNPFLQGIDQVYVVNVVSAEVRFFHVARWQDASLDPQREDPKVLRAMGWPMAEATPMPPDPVVLSSAQDAIAAVQLFAQSASAVIPADDLGLGLGSAIALVGPDDSPAGLHRNALKNMLNDHLNQTWMVIELALSDLAHGIARKFLTESEIEMLSNITVEFEDGTRVQISIERILDGVAGSDTYFDLNISLESITGPGLPAVPMTPGQFAGFQFSGHPLTLQAFIALAQMYGIPVTSAGGAGGGSNGTFECHHDGTMFRCKVTYGAF